MDRIPIEWSHCSAIGSTRWRATELLLLLRRTPDTFWSADAAAQKLGIRADLASRKLSRLVDAKLVVRGRDTGAYRYAPGSDAVRALIDRIADAYEQRHLEKLRAFSDAFRLKKE